MIVGFRSNVVLFLNAVVLFLINIDARSDYCSNPVVCVYEFQVLFHNLSVISVVLLVCAA